MTLMLACVLCGLDRPLSPEGLCQNSANPDDPRPRFNACEDLIGHLGGRLRQTGRARLRTNQRTVEDAQRLLTYAAQGLPLIFEVGPSWVLAEADGEADPQPRAVQPRRVVGGFVIDDLDIGKMHMDLIEAKRKASLYREIAQVEDGWQDAAVQAQSAVKQLQELITAWEDDHAN